ncbi:hypothetical protein, partial [Phocaeicola vulgatus]|uniref:hypothetical protein n=1 Tax=Phocaeicola vulgatus TaxID=821 RepID=UPI00210C6702
DESLIMGKLRQKMMCLKNYRTIFGSHKALIADEINVSPLFKNTTGIDVPYEYLPTAVITLFEFGSVGKST